jgi:hypothetical protein
MSATMRTVFFLLFFVPSIPHLDFSAISSIFYYLFFFLLARLSLRVGGALSLTRES